MIERGRGRRVERWNERERKGRRGERTGNQLDPTLFSSYPTCLIPFPAAAFPFPEKTRFPPAKTLRLTSGSRGRAAPWLLSAFYDTLSLSHALSPLLPSAHSQYCMPPRLISAEQAPSVGGGRRGPSLALCTEINSIGGRIIDQLGRFLLRNCAVYPLIPS